MTNRTRRHRGFTLVELVVSLSITAVLMTGIGSALVIASRAIPDPQSNPWAAAPNTISALDTIIADLMVAQTVTEKTSLAVTLTVASRDVSIEGGPPETIRYAWAGSAGDPVTRRLNNGTIINLLDGVEYFNLVYSLATTTETTTSPSTTEPEGAIAVFENWGGIIATEFAVGPDRFIAQNFPLVAVPAGATSLQITRAKVKLREGVVNPTALISATIQPVDPTTGKPTGTPIGSPALALTSSLSTTPAWVEFTFTDVEIANPVSSTKYALVVDGTATGTAFVQHQYWKQAPVDDFIMFWSTNSGGSWSPANNAKDDYGMPFYVYGAFTTNASSETTLTRYYLKGVEVSLNTHIADESELVAGTPVLNLPEVSGP